MSVHPFRVRPIWLAWRRWRALLLAAFALGLLAGCSQSAPVGLLFNAAPWQSGETHTFGVTAVDGNRAGLATYSITAGDDAGGEGTWLLTRITQSQGNTETNTTTVSAAGFRPFASLLMRTSAAGMETVDARYDGPAVEMVLTTLANVKTNQRAEVPSDVREMVTLPMLVRALPLASDYATQINTFLPVVGALDRATIRVVGDESLTTPAGAYDAWVVTLDTGDAVSRLWIAKDAPYPLVKLIDGRNQATFELESFIPAQ